MGNYPKYDGKLPQDVLGAALRKVWGENGGYAQYDGEQYQLTIFPASRPRPHEEPSGNTGHIKPSGFGSGTSKR